MGLDSKMNENERGIFKLHGITGMLIATVLLLSILVFLTINAISVQNNESTNYYKINQDLNGLTSGSNFSERKQNTPEEQAKHYILIKEKK
jgi:ABC-type phosphate transport system permease subunit